ncbi:PQQ-binding-like beta-propeller repeat protein [candidate division WOR-3 bacterium]|nr:PQQ-binding-like beta-propeller repeat protein [candidate division WOR-3 bacterium]
MKRMLICTIIALLAASAGLYAQEKTQAEPKVNLKVVYEKTFDEPIVDVIFDTATVSIEEAIEIGWKEEALTSEDKIKGKTTVFYPKLVFISDVSKLSHDRSEYPRCRREIRFYRRNGELIKKELTQPWGERVIYSENGEYILRSWIPSEYVSERQGGTLYKSDCTVVWKKGENELVAVSSDGYVMAKDPTYGEEPSDGHIFYEPSGKEIARIVNPLNDKVVGYTAAKFSPYGDYAIIGYTDFKKTVIILADKEGHILWQQEFDWRSYTPYEMDIVEDLGMIGVCNKDGASVFFIDQKGDLKWIVPLEIRGNMIVKISEDKKNVYVASSKGYIWCININNGKFLWKHREEWATDPLFAERRVSWEIPRPRELRVINDTLYIIGKQGRDWHSSTLFVFDGATGSLCKKEEYPQQKITFAQIENAVGLISITKAKVSIFKQEVLK